MIARLKGVLSEKFEHACILDVHDVGYYVSVSDDVLHTNKEGQEVVLYIHQHVREDALELYGFASRDALDLFKHLISVSGVGPKTALALISMTSTEKIRGAIAAGESALLKTVSGIGGKTAERIVVELREKFRSYTAQGAVLQTAEDGDIIDALVGLGYPLHHARKALEHVSMLSGVEERLRAALQILGRERGL